MAYPNQYTYEIGNVVQLRGTQGFQPAVVKWRGKIRSAKGGATYVYLLDNGYWDCYYEDELRSAWRGNE